MVKAIGSLGEFRELINGDKPVVIDFWATWCGPCRMISPIFEKLEAQFSNVVFAKVDVDAQQEISEECAIQAMPTFIAFKDGNQLDLMKGANPTGLEQFLLKASSS